MRRLRLAVVLAGVVVAAVSIIPSVAGATTVHYGVPGLELCGSLPRSQCYIGPVRDHFTNYDNVCSDDNCYFVSAADFERIADGVTPSPSMLETDFTAVGQTLSGDLTNPQPLWTYWKTSGIDGDYLSSETAISKGKSSVESAVDAHWAVIADDFTPAPAFIGVKKFGAGTGIMIADGYTPKGPLVVFQGTTYQMTWAQWNAQIRSVFKLIASTTPPSGSTPPVTSTPAPTDALALSSNTITSAGGVVTLTYSSENATSCSLTSSPSIWASATEPASCNGTYDDSVPSSTAAKQWTFTFTATNSDGQSATSMQTLVESAPAALTPQFDNPSPNWSGYVVPSSGELVTDVSGDWTVPTLNCSDTPNADSSTWVGIGNPGSSGALLQTGIADNCANGIQQDTAWWEIVPATPNHEEEFTDFPVAPGEQMQAFVFELSDGAWETLVFDLDTGLSALMVTGDAWGVGQRKVARSPSRNKVTPRDTTITAPIQPNGSWRTQKRVLPIPVVRFTPLPTSAQ